MSTYYLLTGASGLLGSYLLRDALSAGLRLAVLVRSSVLESARQRIESILARWEQQTGQVLPRPVVLEGDICRPNLGLTEEQQQWVAGHCHSIIHSAASLSFEFDEKTNEPWRSNLEGTRNVVAFARLSGIRQFHHVSTAYICGMRMGRILESEVNVGQTLSNPYEESKLQSEEHVRQAGCFDRLTVYRPAIIVGDSQTGYTTTYHGFYTPLKVVHLMSGKVPPAELHVAPLLRILGLHGGERKNFVPVDWVSSVMTEILARPELHGQTYHLTPDERVTIADMAKVMEQAIVKYSLSSVPMASDFTVDGSAFERLFRQQMMSYKSYWRDDPEFDKSNVVQAVPDRPCPLLDESVMLNMCKYAIESNFGWPVPQPLPPARNVADDLAASVGAASWNHAGSDLFSGNCHGSAALLNLEISGSGGGQWSLALHAGQLVGLGEGLEQSADAAVYLTSTTWNQLVQGRLAPVDTLRQGRLVVEQEGLDSAAVLAVLGRAVDGHLQPHLPNQTYSPREMPAKSAHA